MTISAPTREEAKVNARLCFLAFREHRMPPAEALANVGKEWAEPIKQTAKVFRDNPANVDNLLRGMIRTGKFPGLAELLQDKSMGQQTDEEEKPVSASDNVDQVTPLYTVPPLHPVTKANEARAAEASPILDAMIDFFRYWCTRSYEGYHEAVALWVLSTIAARRVYLPWRGGTWTPLYIMLVADSTTHAKTEAAACGRSIIEACGLEILLCADEITPQKLMHNMAGDVTTLPRNYACLPPDKKEQTRLRIAFSGQQGWVYDEFGNKLQEIVNAKGHNAYFYGLLKQLYDSKRQYVYETISRAGDRIEMPSLSIIGTATPACLRPIMGKNSAIYTDGSSARIAFSVAPKNELKLQSAPNEERVVPSKIVRALQEWHERLGIPTCEIVETELMDTLEGSEKTKKTKDQPPYEIVRGELPQNPIIMSNEVYRAHEAYYASLATLNFDFKLDERFASNYGRLPDMALRIAMLLASLENDGRMDMRHWARGQQIAERWRYDFHELIFQLDNSNTGGYGELEQLVLDVLSEQKNLLNARDISQKRKQLRSAGSPKVREICNELEAAKVIGKQGVGKDALYGLKELVQNDH